jgi:hypothetical protein
MVPVGVCAAAEKPRKAIAIRQNDEGNSFMLPPEIADLEREQTWRGESTSRPPYSLSTGIGIFYLDF